MKNLQSRRFALAAALLAGCVGQSTPSQPHPEGEPDRALPAPAPEAPPALAPAAAPHLAKPLPETAATEGGPENTFEHAQSDGRDPFDINKQKYDDGLPSTSARMHSCQKIPYAALGALLTSRGVNLKAVAAQGQPLTAGQIYTISAQSLGAPNYGARTREGTQQTAAGATKVMDVFLQAAPEIIKAMPNVKACQVGGAPTSMFDGKGDCTQEGITCLMGSPATPQHAKLCSQLIKDAPSTALGQQLAVAVVLSAAHTCE
ncbi:MAG: hypothetical protein EXR72_14485 [Myxococcales bacterium]|nr:hypothetical protein [Myxococcales bacterium]